MNRRLLIAGLCVLLWASGANGEDAPVAVDQPAIPNPNDVQPQIVPVPEIPKADDPALPATKESSVSTFDSLHFLLIIFFSVEHRLLSRVRRRLLGDRGLRVGRQDVVHRRHHGDATLAIGRFRRRHDRSCPHDDPFRFVHSSSIIATSCISACLGWVTQVIPRQLTFYISTALFALFGLKMLHEGYHMSPNEGQEEYEEAQAEVQKSDVDLETNKYSEMESGGSAQAR